MVAIRSGADRSAEAGDSGSATSMARASVSSTSHGPLRDCLGASVRCCDRCGRRFTANTVGSVSHWAEGVGSSGGIGSTSWMMAALLIR